MHRRDALTATALSLFSIFTGCKPPKLARSASPDTIRSVRLAIDRGFESRADAERLFPSMTARGISTDELDSLTEQEAIDLLDLFRVF